MRVAQGQERGVAVGREISGLLGATDGGSKWKRVGARPRGSLASLNRGTRTRCARRCAPWSCSANRGTAGTKGSGTSTTRKGGSCQTRRTKALRRMQRTQQPQERRSLSCSDSARLARALAACGMKLRRTWFSDRMRIRSDDVCVLSPTPVWCACRATSLTPSRSDSATR